MGTVADSNVYIFAALEDAPEREAALAALRSARERGEVVLNPVIVSEVFYQLGRLKSKGEALEFAFDLLRGTPVEPLPAEELREACALSEKTCLRINDALIARHALSRGHELVTFDADFRKVRGLKLRKL